MPKQLKQLIYWDAEAFLSLFNKDKSPEKCESCERVWYACANGQILLVTSTLTIAEVIYLKGSPKLDPSKRVQVNNFFRADHIALRPLTRAIAELARDIVWDCNVKPKDAVHVATAGYWKVNTLHTFDDGLLNQGTVNVNGFSVIIAKPYAQIQSELFPK